MKRLLAISITLFVSVSFAQSPTAFRSLDLVGAKKPYGVPVEYNAWAGSRLSYPLLGDDFDLAFGVSGKVVIDFATFKAGRVWNVLAYGDLGLPNYNRINAFSAVAQADEGIAVGFQAYTIFGSLNEEAFTAYLNAAAKLNTFGGTVINSYRFGVGLEVSLRGGGLPIIVNISPAYVLLDSQNKFAGVQQEISAKGFWTTDTFLIVPVGDRLGLLLQSTFAENVSPQVRFGLIVAAGL